MRKLVYVPAENQALARRSPWLLRVVALAIFVAAGAVSNMPAWGQSTPPSGDSQSQTTAHEKKEAQPASTAPVKHKWGPFDVSVSWRFRVEGWDWFNSGTGENNYAFPHSLLRLGIGQTGERLDWQVEAEQVSVLGLPSGAVVATPQGQLGLGGTYYAANGNHPNNAYVFAKQAYLRIKNLDHATVRFGRFEYFDGTEVTPKDPTVATLVQTRIAQRLIGNFGFSAVQRSFDGVQVGFNLGQDNLTILAARPTRGVYQVNGMGELDVDLYYGALTVPVEYDGGAGELRVFGIGYVDHRRKLVKTDNRSAASKCPKNPADCTMIEIGTYGADYVAVFNTADAGKFNFLVWGAYQSGSWGNLTQRAGAFVGEAGWQPPVQKGKRWLSGGFSWGSGDDNPNDSTHGTFFQILPTPRTYARFPFFNMENNQDFYGSLGLRPHPKLSIRSEGHALRLDQAADLWYLGGGAFQRRTFGYTGRPSGGHRSLANVWDISADTQVTPFFSVGLYYGYAWGKSVIQSIYPKDSSGQFAFIETNFRY